MPKNTRKNNRDNRNQSVTPKRTMRQFYDSWQNNATGLGTSKDSQTYLTTRNRGISYKELSDLYDSDGIAAQIVNVPADDMFREGYTIVGDDENNSIAKYLERLNTDQNFNQGVKWDRLYGGAIILIGIKDGTEISQQFMPVNTRNIESISFLRVFPREFVTINSYYTEDDARADDSLIAKIGMPKIYQLSLSGGSVTDNLIVHESRVIRFNFMDASVRYREDNEGWGVPELQRCFNALGYLGVGYSNSSRGMDTSNERIMQVDNLGDYLKDSKNTSALQKRIENFNLVRSMQNVLVTSSQENLTAITNDLSSFKEIIDKFELFICAIARIPHTKLFGNTPSGLNSSADEDTRNYYDDIKLEQENDLKPVLNQLIYYVSLAIDSGFRGNAEDLSVEFNSLWQMSDEQVADIELKQAQRDQIYLQWNVETANSIREKRGID
jgi:phage-related protein (TIGR01555 family)